MNETQATLESLQAANTGQTEQIGTFQAEIARVTQELADARDLLTRKQHEFQAFETSLREELEGVQKLWQEDKENTRAENEKALSALRTELRQSYDSEARIQERENYFHQTARRHERRVRSQARALKRSGEAIAKLTEDLEKRKAQLDTLSQGSHQSEEKLTGELARADNELTRVRQHVAELEKHLESERAAVKEASGRFYQTRHDHELAISKLKQSQAENEDLHKLSTELRTELESSQSSFVALTSEVERLVTDDEKKAEQLDAYERQFEDQKSNEAQLRKALSSLEAEQARLRDAMSTANSEARDKAAQIQQIEMERSQAAAKLDHYQTENENLNVQVSELKTELGASQSTIASLSSEVERLSALDARQTKTISDNKKRLDAQTDTEGKLQRTLATLEDERNKLRAELDAASRETEDKTAELRQAQGAHERLISKLEQQRSDVEDVQSQLAQMRQERETLNSSILSLQSQIARLATTEERQNETISDYRKQLDDHKINEAEMQGALLSIEEDRARLQEALNAATIESETKTVQLERLAKESGETDSLAETAKLESELAAARVAARDIGQEHALIASQLSEVQAKLKAADALIEKRPVPSIVFNTLPKSGSVFITRLIAQSLDMSFEPLTNSYFPSDVIKLEQAEALRSGNMISQDHFPASEINIHYLAQFAPRLVLNVRDPRQAALSWGHHLDNLHSSATFAHARGLLRNVFPKLPDNYFDQDFEQRIDWVIDNHIPLLVTWLEDWLRIFDTQAEHGLSIHLARLEDFIADDRAYIRTLLGFLNIPESWFSWDAPDKTPAMHYRRGEIDEWRRVFTRDQKKRVSEIVPETLLQRLDYDVAAE